LKGKTVALEVTIRFSESIIEKAKEEREKNQKKEAKEREKEGCLGAEEPIGRGARVDLGKKNRNN